MVDQLGSFLVGIKPTFLELLTDPKHKVSNHLIAGNT